MNVEANNNDTFKYILTAGLAGALAGYFLASRRKNNANSVEKLTAIDLDKFNETSQCKLVPLLNRVKEKLESYPRILARNFVKVENTQHYENKFRIMQWNTLARGLFTNDAEPNLRSHFTPDTPADTYDWHKFRKWRVLEEVLRFDNDIICLEEVDYYEEIKPYLHSLGYTSYFIPKYKSTCLKMRTNYGPDGSVIFYKTSKFQVHNVHFENYSQNEENFDQIFAIIQLKHLSSGKRFTLVNTHLKSKEENHERRAVEIDYMLRVLKKHLNTVEDLDSHPIIITGDFNGEPFEKFYSFIMHDKQLKFDNSHAACVSADGKFLPTTFKIRKSVIARTIDYVFYTKQSLKLLQYLEMPDISKIPAVPNLTYPSDHFSLVCDFEIL